LLSQAKNCWDKKSDGWCEGEVLVTRMGSMTQLVGDAKMDIYGGCGVVVFQLLLKLRRL